MGVKLELKDLIQPEEIKNDNNSATDLIKLQVAESLISNKNLKRILELNMNRCRIYLNYIYMLKYSILTLLEI